MMASRSRRKTTRTQAWRDTRATVELIHSESLNGEKSLRISGQVENIGAGGMFLHTDNYVPVPSKADIFISFDSEAEVPLLDVSAKGRIIRRSEDGVGIKFTYINLAKLQHCIITRLNLASEKGRNPLNN